MNSFKHLRFPIGEFSPPTNISSTAVEEATKIIASFPEKLNLVATDLNTNQLNWRYRPEGWNIKQVIHHCADSHMNSYMRFKLTITEDEPTIKPYFEDCWAETVDGNSNDIKSSLLLIEGLHGRWAGFIQSLSQDDLNRCHMHPEHGRKIPLVENVFFYAWHCKHHLAHIQQALAAKGKYN